MNTLNDYLCHYGVLGMRWGVHNASRASEKSTQAKNKALTYQNSDVNKYNKYMNKSTKYAAKSERITAKHKARAGSAYDYTNNESLAKTVGKSLVFGTYGTLKYNALRGAGTGRIASAGGAALMGVANAYSSGLLSVIEPRVSAHSRKSSGNGLEEATAGITKAADDLTKKIVNE